MRVVVVVLGALLAGCVSTNSVVCGDGRVCPSGTLCDDSHSMCIVSAQLTACDGLADGAPCMYGDVLVGFCNGGVCFESTCGDGIAVAPEQCDGADLGGRTCLDRGFYEPDGLVCTSACILDTDACQGSCGDRGQHILNGGEICDGSPPAESCVDLGFGMGIIGCTGMCGPDLLGCKRLELTTPKTDGTGDVRGVWAANGIAMFSVGAILGPPDVGEIQRFDGISWTVMTTGTIPALDDVWGFAANDVFAVGAGGTILHFDGSSWTAMTSGTTVELFDVWGTDASNVFAVGANGTILHYNGSAWSAMTSPTGNDLLGVWGSGGSDVYAVGKLGPSYLHYDGSSWSVSATALPASGFVDEIWGSSATDIYAVGLGTTATSSKSGRIYHSDGATWTEVTPVTTLPELTSVWGAGPNDVFVVGLNGFVEHFGGELAAPSTQVWRQLARVPQDLFAVSGADSTHVLVGGTTSTLLHFAGTAQLRQAMTTGAMGTAHAISALGERDIIVVGNELGTQDQIHHFKNGVWTTEACPISGLLTGVVQLSTIRAFATSGAPNTVTTNHLLSYAGGTWSTVTLTTDVPLHGIAAAGARVFAVGDNGNIATTSNGGISWSEGQVGTSSRLNAVWIRSSSDAFAVGFGGTIVRFDGLGWTEMTSPTTRALNAVTGSTSTGDVYAVGNMGTFLHFDGTTWSQIAVPAMNQDLTSVWLGAGDDLFVGGAGGIYLHRVGAGWVPIDSSAVLSVQAIFGSGRSVYTAGASSTLDELYRTTLAVGPETACGDYWDDNGNGLTDACDPACAGHAPIEQCANGFDDDCDGLTDCDDPDCDHAAACTKP